MRRLLLALFLVVACLSASDTKPATPKKDSHEALAIAGNSDPSFKGIVILTSSDIPDIAYTAYYCGKLDGVINALNLIGGFEERVKRGAGVPALPCHIPDQLAESEILPHMPRDRQRGEDAQIQRATERAPTEVPAMTAYELTQDFIFRLCVWREARGQSDEARRAVAHVLLNRAANPRDVYHNCPDVLTNVLCHGQFASFTPPDPNASRLPNPYDPVEWRAWLECCAVCDDPGQDPTAGATHYHSYDPHDARWPKWATAERQTAMLGAFRFYKLW